jgi:hypothetical protein
VSDEKILWLVFIGFVFASGCAGAAAPFAAAFGWARVKGAPPPRCARNGFLVLLATSAGCLGAFGFLTFTSLALPVPTNGLTIERLWSLTLASAFVVGACAILAALAREAILGEVILGKDWVEAAAAMESASSRRCGGGWPGDEENWYDGGGPGAEDE